MNSILDAVHWMVMYVDTPEKLYLLYKTVFHRSCNNDTNGGTSAVTGSGTISTVTDTISSIDVSSLDDDTLTLTVYLTDTAGNQGSNQTGNVVKTAPSTLSSIAVTGHYTVDNGTYVKTGTENGKDHGVGTINSCGGDVDVKIN